IEQRLNDPVLWPTGLRTAKAESAAIRGALGELRQKAGGLPPIPVQVLTAGGVKSKSARAVHERWKELVSHAPEAHHTDVPTSGHNMPIECPDIVANAILGVLDATGHHP